VISNCLNRCGVVSVLLLLWAANSVVFCAAATRAEAAMACCPPSDCAMVSAVSQQNCCAVQSNPARPAVSPVVLTDHVTDNVIATAIVSVEAPAHEISFVAPPVSPNAPPGSNSILRI
jgi:hypothetical protein